MSQTLCQTLHAFHHLFLRATHLQIFNLHGGVGIQTQAFLTVYWCTYLVTCFVFTGFLQYPPGVSRQLAILSQRLTLLYRWV